MRTMQHTTPTPGAQTAPDRPGGNATPDGKFSQRQLTARAILLRQAWRRSANAAGLARPGVTTGPHGALGNTTNFASELDPNPEKRAKRAVIYGRLRAAKRVLPGESRVHICQTVQPANFKGQGGAGDVELRQSPDGAVGYGGLFSCGNTWSCPVCATRSAAEKSALVVEAMERHRLCGGYTYLITYTFRHNVTMPLAPTLAAMRRAQRRLKSGAWYKGQDFVVGTIGALEITHGANGWHPHAHEVVFTSRPWDKVDTDNWRARWLHVLEIEELDGEGVAFDCIPATPSGYLAKWGADGELTGGGEKTGKGANPWQLLDRSTGDPRAAALFLEYVEALKGRSRLRWSRGLKDRLDLRGPQPLREHTTVGRLRRDEYLHLTALGYEGYFLDLVRCYGFAAAYGAVFLGQPITDAFAIIG